MVKLTVYRLRGVLDRQTTPRPPSRRMLLASSYMPLTVRSHVDVGYTAEMKRHSVPPLFSTQCNKLVIKKSSELCTAKHQVCTQDAIGITVFVVVYRMPVISDVSRWKQQRPATSDCCSVARNIQQVNTMAADSLQLLHAPSNIRLYPLNRVRILINGWTLWLCYSWLFASYCTVTVRLLRANELVLPD